MNHRLRARRVSSGHVLTATRAALLALADRLFGVPTSQHEPDRRWLLRYLGVTALLVAIIVARRPDAVTNPQFWAEDGYVYFLENLTLGFTHAFSKLYNGYPNLAQRLIAMVGGWVPLATAPRVYTTSAIALTALAVASFALPGFRHLVRSDALRVGFCVAAVSAPFQQEVLSTPTNLGWFLAVWLALLSVMRLPRRRWQMTGLALAGCAATLSTPLAPLNLPLWLLRVWRGIERRDRADLWLGVTLVLALVLVVLLTRNLGALSAPEIPQLRRSAGFDVLSWLCMTSYWCAALLLGPGRLTEVQTLVIGLLMFAALGWVALRTWTQLRPGLSVALYYFAGSFFFLLLGRPLWFAAMSGWSGLASRYVVFPAAMLGLATVSILDTVRAGLPRTLAGAAVTGLVGWSWSAYFVITPFIDQRWADHAVLLEQKLKHKSLEPLVIPMNPPWVFLKVDPLFLSSEVDVPPSAIVGSLGTHGTFRQSFLCRCEPLRAIDVMLAAAARSSQGSLTMSLIEEPGTRVVARSQIPRERIGREPTWQSFFFDPIPGSAGKRYVIVIKAVENDLEATIYVLGAPGNPYPEGSAVFSSTPIDADATFRYGCIPPS
ncbi:MAG TPA: hypothetical protein VKH82_16145 [Candidatus Binatia bacterium]|nr:hypothetical protein [Candidatus Binatia bacterium]